jgi:hypothetical protein
MGGAIYAQEQTPLPTTAEIKTLVEGGKYREALRPLGRVLGLKGSAATGFDRYEILMLKAECHLQLKDQRLTLETLELARKEAFTQDKVERASLPAAMIVLVQKSTGWQYKPRTDKGAKPIPILDKTLRTAAIAALFADELPAAKKMAQALADAKTMTPVLEAAKVVGAAHALEAVAKPDFDAASRETSPLVGLVTSNADRLLRAAMEEMAKKADAIQVTANDIVTDQVGRYDPISKKSWLESRTRRRGPTDDEAKALAAMEVTCDKIVASAVDLAVVLAADFSAYRELIDKATAVKVKVGGVLRQDYLVVPK